VEFYNERSAPSFSHNHQPLYNQKNPYVTNGILQGYSPLSSSSSGTYVNTNFGTSFNTASYSSGGVGVGSEYYYQFYFNIRTFWWSKKLMKSTIETGTVEKAVIPLKHLKVLINHSTILLSTLQAINYYLFHKK
jgi:hypothetical protein